MKWFASNWVNWSNLIWATWIGLFLILEFSGWFGWVPWRTLSETVWQDETSYPILYFLIGGFLCGLTLHFLSRVPLGTAVAIGLVVAALSHVLDGWPKW